MSDILKPKLDPSIIEKIRSATASSDNVLEIGRSAMDGEFIEIKTPNHRPNFYDLEKGRGTTIVDMDEHGDITVAIGEEKRIATFGLRGCNAVAISAELPDGTRRGYMQHYGAVNQQLSVDMLSEATDRFANEGASNVRAVVMTPGEWTQDPSAKWAMFPKDELITKFLTLTIQARLGEEADVQIYPYSENLSAGHHAQGTLMVEFRADGATNILAESMPVF